MSYTEVNSPFNFTIATGGGAGSAMGPGLVEALGPDFNVSVVVPTGDSGSKTGEIREIYGGPAVGDARKVLAAVSGNSAGKLFDSRFGPEASPDTIKELSDRMLGVLAAKGADLNRAASILDTTVELGRHLPDGLRGHTYGNLVLTSLRLDHEGDIVLAVQEAGEWLDARAAVIPVTAEAHTVCMWDGEQVVVGEDMVDRHRVANPSEVRIWLENAEGRSPKITPEAYTAFARAGKLLIGPGSHLTSLLPIEHTEGVAKAVAEQKERGGSLDTVVNLVAEDHAMPQMNVADHERLLEAPLGRKFDLVLFNTALDTLPEGRVPVGHEAEVISQVKARAIGANLVGAHTVHDPNDPIEHLRGPVHHNVQSIVWTLRKHDLLPPVELGELATV